MERQVKQIQSDALCVVQAMLGVISSNFRMVSLKRQRYKLIIQVILEHQDEEDAEEINESISELGGLLHKNDIIEMHVSVSDQKIIMQPQSETSMTIFRRRE
jgi:hypothetical protein